MVFSGIVEEIGSVKSLTQAEDILLWDGSKGSGWVLVVAASSSLQGAYEGCSIAVNGTCLTVTSFDKDSFTVGLAPES
jgi:riboflavin synthase